ncbi:nicotinate-nucleotide--dimethylbenzimidazole phosphoribosyltransferase, partial [Streptomyces griseus]|uniref:nicotinate-nucleotide--dimethylbenzimidazole phosphoribosyltransferase n=1 Tax=Streptomyces griseus TaxID=1911 RepID=UPI000D1B9A98
TACSGCSTASAGTGTVSGCACGGCAPHGAPACGGISPSCGPGRVEGSSAGTSKYSGPQLGEIPPQAGAPWGAQPPQAQPETVPVPAEAVEQPEQAVQPEQLVEVAQPVAEPETAAGPAAAAEAAQPVAEVEQPVETVPPVQAAEPVTVSAPAAPADQPEQLSQPDQPIQPEQLSEQPVQPAAVTQPEPAVQSEPVAQAEPAPQPEPVLETEPAPQAVPAETVVPEPAAVELPPAGPVVVPEPEAAQPETPVEAPVQPLADEVTPAPEAQAPEAEAQAAPVHAAAPESPAPAPEQPVAEPVVQPDPVAQPEQELPVEPAPEPALAVTPVAAPEPVAAPLAPEPVQPQPAAELPAEPAEQLPVTEQEAAPAPEPAEATTAETADGTADGAADATAAAHVAAPGAEDGTGPEVIETPELPEPLEPELAERTPATAPQQPQTDAPQNTGTADSTDSPQQPRTEPAPQPEEPAEASTPPAPGYDDAEREAVLRVMRERRDIRNGFRSDPIPHEVLLRVLEAAHTAPSVGHSQPWDFVVIRSAETRRSMHELAQSQRDAYAKSLPKGRAKQFKELKIEAILDTPVNIVVTADPTRGGRHTLGRHTQPQMAPYSSALAVENLWLAARAEGLGVGWVSFFDEREMVRALGLPEHLEVVAYLCVGYVDEFPEEPELMQAGWSKRRPLSWVVHEETYGRRALPGAEPHDLLQETISAIRPLDAKALGEAWERQKRMTKPAGALGMLEIISAQLSGLSRMCPPPIPEPAAVAIFAGDHGVHAQGVTAWPQEVTAQMVANFLGGGAVCNAFAAQVGAEVCVVDVGVATDLPATPGLLPRKVRPGTADFTTGPALTREEVLAAIEVGIETARDLVAAGNKALLTGEMGIANTTASAALICVYTGIDASEVTGRGTGINDEMHARKVDVVRRALDLHQPDASDPIGVLAAVGGLEHAAMAGFLLGGASLRTPVVLDGVSAGAAALVARAIAPEALAACIAGHRSAEPGHVAALNKLGLRPLVDLDLRLGEGTGALLALPIVQSAARAMHEVATFDSAGVTEK